MLNTDKLDKVELLQIAGNDVTVLATYKTGTHRRYTITTDEYDHIQKCGVMVTVEGEVDGDAPSIYEAMIDGATRVKFFRAPALNGDNQHVEGLRMNVNVKTGPSGYVTAMARDRAVKMYQWLVEQFGKPRKTSSSWIFELA